jgi:predicted RecA/RadA family phage recombinase
MGARYLGGGTRIDYTPVAAVSAEDVLVFENQMVAVASEPIAAGRTGSMFIQAKARFDKENVAFAVGEDVYYDEANELAFAGQGAYVGKCIAAAAADDDTVDLIMVLQETAVSGTESGTGTGG